MTKINEVQIKCIKKGCGSWFKSPISFGDSQSFETTMMSGNTVQCPKCGTMTPCNKENMRVRGANSGFVGAHTN